MHKENFEITLENISKIEGHADLDIKVKEGLVEDVRLRITENKRFFTEAVRGKPAKAVHQIVSRICGTCSIAHLTACIETVEDIYGHEPSEQTLLLRHLLLYGLNIRDHAMHLYLFCLPDLFGKDSILDFPDDDSYEHELVHRALDVKSTGNKLSIIVGGRAVHSPFPVVGGWIKVPKKEELKALIPELKKARTDAMEFVKIFYDCQFKLDNPNNEYIALKNDDFSYLGKQLCSTEKYCIPKEQFVSHLEQKVIPYSQALGFHFSGKPYIVGALARMNLNGNSMHAQTRKDLEEYMKVFPSSNIFHNNLAQAIEIVNCIDRAIELIEKYEEKPEKPPVLLKPVKQEGIGVIEAPRGTLYYHLKVDEIGKITYANLVIPTAQNQIMIERNSGRIVQACLDQEKGKEIIQHEIEKLIRAYDPCMSCATHFLKINWKERE
ncbi:nickel-dependent hydrogenase large subunit [Candidatus Micrarchaeota archaeon]|nr:nickel-dependent hydrogenase large subunit [Candidatus Micrarchaeota archaeon]